MLDDDKIKRLHGKGAVPKALMETYRKIARESGYQTLADLYNACGNSDGDAATLEELAILAGYSWKCAVTDGEGDACNYVNDADASVCGGCQAAKP
jgi:hypothetical protein